MTKRLLLVIAFLFLPTLAMADSTSIPDQATQELGPQTENPSTSSSADSSTLQPAGTSTLQQSVDNSQTSELGGASAQVLQSPDVSQGELQVISDGADGDPESVGGNGVTMLDLVGLSLVIGALVALIAWLYGTRPGLLGRRKRLAD
jgi:hypothetical protein